MYGVLQTCLFMPLINFRLCLKCLPLKWKFPQLLKNSFKDLSLPIPPCPEPTLAPAVIYPTQTTHIHHILALFWSQLSYVYENMHMRARPSENTHILSLSLMDEEMLAQTHKQKPPSLFLELHLSRSGLWRTSRPRPPPILSFSLWGSGPTWLSACFPWRLPTSVPRPGGGRWEHSLRHRLSTPEGWGPAAVPAVRGPCRKHLSQAAAHHLQTLFLAQV